MAGHRKDTSFVLCFFFYPAAASTHNTLSSLPDISTYYSGFMIADVTAVDQTKAEVPSNLNHSPFSPASTRGCQPVSFWEKMVKESIRDGRCELTDELRISQALLIDKEALRLHLERSRTWKYNPIILAQAQIASQRAGIVKKYASFRHVWVSEWFEGYFFPHIQSWCSW